MGLFGRLKFSPSATFSSSNHDSPSTPRIPTSPSQPMLSSRLPPASPSAHSTVSKSSKKSWWKGIRTHAVSDFGSRSGSPVPSLPPMRFDHPTHIVPVGPGQNFSSQSVSTGHNQASTKLPEPPQSRPIAIPAPADLRISSDGKPTPKKGRKDRVASVEFKQDGGILGRLGFEFGSSPLGGDIVLVDDLGADANTLDETVRASMETTGRIIGEDDLGMSGGTASPMLTMEALESDQPNHEEQQGVAGNALDGPIELEDEHEEVLVTPGKKHRFLKGIGRTRRMSKAMSDVDHEERASSPTPRKSSPQIYNLEPSTTSPTIPAPRDPSLPPGSRPHQLRRLSSNLLNPFHRSHSRQSMVDDSQSNLDDKSFQLKGFRHVSGISDIEGSGYDSYINHADQRYKRSQSAVHLNGPHSSPKNDSMDSMPLTRPYISRPPSIAGSINDDFPSVSVAAFRKGIRRASEGIPTTMSDIGHGSRREKGDDDDDDVPLSQIVRTPDFARTKSALSLSSMKAESPSVENVDRRTSPGPGLSFTVTKHARNKDGGSAGGGFVVMSSRTTRSIGRTPSPSQSLQMSPRSQSPDNSRKSPPQPLRIPTQLYRDSQHFVGSPLVVSPAESYFSSIPPIAGQGVKDPSIEPTPTPLSELRPKPDFGEGSFPSPLPTGTQSNFVKDGPPSSEQSKRLSASLPPPAPVPVPTPVTEALNLPLPPDQMPDTPPKPPLHLDDLPRRPASATSSPLLGARKMSFLEEPMRLISGISVSGISGLWSGGQATTPSSPTAKDDGFDHDLVLRSMHVLGGDEDCQIPPVKDEHPRHAVTPSSPAVGSDVIRSTLQERLAVAAAQGKGRPSMTQLQINEDTDADGLTEKWRSPISDSDTASPSNPTISGSALTTSRSEVNLKSSAASSRTSPPTSFSRVSRPTQVATRRATSKGWASSSDEDAAKPVTLMRSRVSIRKAPVGPRPLSRAGTITSAQPKVERLKSKDIDNDGAQSGDESSEDEPLAVIRDRAFRSQSSLGYSPGGMGRNVPLPSSPSISISISSHVTSPVVPRSEHGHIRLSMLDKPVLNQSTSGSPPSASSKTSQTKAPIGGNRLVTELHRKTASPDSSLSGLTVESANYLPVTPRDQSVEETLRTSVDVGKGTQAPRNRRVSDAISQMAQSQYDFRNNVEPQSNHSMSSGYSADPHMQMHSWSPQIGYMPMSSMDPALAYQQMLKQQWQASYMAAAYRASEDEWERASSVSGHQSNSQSASTQFAQPMPPFPQYPFQTSIMPPANIPFGYPSSQMQYMYPYPGNTAALPYGDAQGMYMPPPAGYAYPQHAAQSVHGGDFGPPSFTPSRNAGSQYSLNSYNDQVSTATAPAHNADSRRSRRLSSTSQVLLTPGDPRASTITVKPTFADSSTAQTPKRPTQTRLKSGTSSSPPPPSSWRRSTDTLGQLDQAAVRAAGRSRPPQFAN